MVWRGAVRQGEVKGGNVMFETWSWKRRITIAATLLLVAIATTTLSAQGVQQNPNCTWTDSPQALVQQEQMLLYGSAAASLWPGGQAAAVVGLALAFGVWLIRQYCGY